MQFKAQNEQELRGCDFHIGHQQWERPITEQFLRVL